MKRFEIEWETDDNEGDYIVLYDEDEAETEFRDIIDDPRTTWATLTEFYIYGGMCQGDKLLQEYKRTE